MLRWALAVCAILLAPAGIRAHESHVTFAKIALTPERSVTLRLLVAGTDMEEVLGRTLTIRGGIVNPHWLADAEAKALAYIRPRVSVGNRAGETCIADARNLLADRADAHGAVRAGARARAVDHCALVWYPNN